MPFPLWLLPLLGAASGGVAQRTQKQSSDWKQSTETSQSQSYHGGSSVRRTLLPQQQAVLDPLATYALNMLRNPAAQLAPIYGHARSAVNAQYANAPSALAQRFLAHGGAASGKYGLAARGIELERLAQLSQLEQGFAREQLAQQANAAALAQNLLSMAFGQETTNYGSSAASGYSSQSGSSMGQVYGNVPFGILGGALSGLGDMMALSILQDILGGKKGI